MPCGRISPGRRRPTRTWRCSRSYFSLTLPRSSKGICRRNPLDRATLPVSRYSRESDDPRRDRNCDRAVARFAVTCTSNSASPMAGTTKGVSESPSASSASFTSMRYVMPLMGNSRSFGFDTRMCTSRRCEKMSALCSLSDATDSLGASHFSADAQPDSIKAAANIAAAERRADLSGVAMREHVGRHQDHAPFRDQILLRVLGPVETDARAGGYLAVGIDDGIGDLAVRCDTYVRKDHRALDERTLFYSHSREQQRLSYRGTRDDHAARYQRVDGDTAPAIF